MPTRHRLALAALLPLLLAAPLRAQRASEGWALQIGVGHLALHGGAADTTAGSESETEVRPGSRIGLAAGLLLRGRSWEGRLELGYASGALEAENDVLALEDKTTRTKRYRAGLLVGRRIASLGPQRLTLLAGPTVDVWTTTQFETQTAFGAQALLELDIPLGAASLVNTLGFGWSGSPFNSADLPPEAARRSLRTVLAGVGVRVGL